jgi:hypothetical protein
MHGKGTSDARRKSTATETPGGSSNVQQLFFGLAMEGEEEQQRKWMRAAPIPMSSAFSFLFFSEDSLSPRKRSRLSSQTNCRSLQGCSLGF